MDWRREDILVVLSWVETANEEANVVALEREYLVVTELLKECGNEIRALRARVAELEQKLVVDPVDRTPEP